MRDDDDEVARAERNLINFMNEVFFIFFIKRKHAKRSNMDGMSNQATIAT